MRIIGLTFVSTALYITSISAHCADLKNSSCSEITTSQQVFECSVLSKSRADEKLNKNYRNLIERVRSQYKPNQALSTEYISKIKYSQRTWIKLRDANCILEAFEIETGSQAYETTLNNCITRMSYERSEYLENIAPSIAD